MVYRLTTTTTGKLVLDLVHHPLLLVALATVTSGIITGGSSGSHPHPLGLTRLVMMTWQLLLNLIRYSLLLPPPSLSIILLYTNFICLLSIIYPIYTGLFIYLVTYRAAGSGSGAVKHSSQATTTFLMELFLALVPSSSASSKGSGPGPCSPVSFATCPVGPTRGSSTSSVTSSSGRSYTATLPVSSAANRVSVLVQLLDRVSVLVSRLSSWPLVRRHLLLLSKDFQFIAKNTLCVI